MKLSVILVSYNTIDLLTQCLQSIYKQSESADYEIIVIDNDSSDGTQSLIQKHFPKIKLIQNSQNLGFAKANNIAVDYATSDTLLFLNSDTIVQSGALADLITLSSDSQVDISSCQLHNPDGTIQPQGGSLPNLFNLFFWMTFLDDLPLIRSIVPRYQQSNYDYFSSDHSMGWLAGTALLVKKQVFMNLQGFDENMFMYGEDVDLCLRAHQKSYSIKYFSSPIITHLGHGSGSKSEARIREFQALIYIFKKHKSSWQLPILKIWLKIGALLRIIIFGIILKDDQSKHIYQQAFKLA